MIQISLVIEISNMRMWGVIERVLCEWLLLYQPTRNRFSKRRVQCPFIRRMWMCERWKAQAKLAKAATTATGSSRLELTRLGQATELQKAIGKCSQAHKSDKHTLISPELSGRFPCRRRCDALAALQFAKLDIVAITFKLCSATQKSGRRSLWLLLLLLSQICSPFLVYLPASANSSFLYIDQPNFLSS